MIFESSRYKLIKQLGKKERKAVYEHSLALTVALEVAFILQSFHIIRNVFEHNGGYTSFGIDVFFLVVLITMFLLENRFYQKAGNLWGKLLLKKERK